MSTVNEDPNSAASGSNSGSDPAASRVDTDVKPETAVTPNETEEPVSRSDLDIIDISKLGSKSNSNSGVQHHAQVVQGAPLESGPPIDADEDLLEGVESDTEEIDLTHLKISSLKKLGLERFPNVKTACFRRNMLTNLKSVESLPKDLENLDLYDNLIERMDHHLEYFSDSNNMDTLDLSFNNIRHIRHIQGLTKLEELFLCQNQITRIENVDTLVNLRNLELGANNIREIANLEPLVNLETLWLAKNKITKIQGLDTLVNLRLLSIQSNRITKIEGLDKLVNLEELYISHNGLTKIEGLENNKKLTTLDIGNNRITELSGLSHLEHLEELWASSNLIESFASVERELGHLKELSTIYLEYNPVQRNNETSYRRKLKLALGPSLKQIDASPVR